MRYKLGRTTWSSDYNGTWRSYEVSVGLSEFQLVAMGATPIPEPEERKLCCPKCGTPTSINGVCSCRAMPKIEEMDIDGWEDLGGPTRDMVIVAKLNQVIKAVNQLLRRSNELPLYW
jgi:hypothetical protein